MTILRPNGVALRLYVPLSMVMRNIGSGMWRLETPLPINKVQFGCHKVAYNLVVDLGLGPQAEPPVRGRLEWTGGVRAN